MVAGFCLWSTRDNYKNFKKLVGQSRQAQMRFDEEQKSNLEFELKAYERRAASHEEALGLYEARMVIHESTAKSLEVIMNKAMAYWESDAAEWKEIADRSNRFVDNLFRDLDAGKFTRLSEFIRLAEHLSHFPEEFPKSITAGYDPESKIVVITRELPNLDTLPLGKIDAKNKVKPINKIDIKRLRKSVPCAIALRTAALVFANDYPSDVEAICFNGETSFIDPRDGHAKRQIVISVVIKREDIESIKLDLVDPLAVIANLNGRLSPDFETSAPVLPVLTLGQSDNRVIDSYFDLNQLSTSTNLAAMDWEEFETLVRELFAREFSGDAMEVKVTQASRDGGVDAIAWDPDPVRGGKFVFQAKRYTNTVDVSAVRDLYGVVMHEGANRGLLVTTSSFGPDAYKFAEGKPITLINGSELLGLLGKHGFKVTIDIEEAKRLLSSR